MKFGIVVFPGSNCDRDMQEAIEKNLGYEVKMLWHKDNDLNGFDKDDCIVLPGGFSYGDYLRCGAVACFSPMMMRVKQFANEGGKVFGVCNGFQILCESGLLPGVLLRNIHQRFICKPVHITTPSGKTLSVPIAHQEGRYYVDEDTLDSMEANNQVIFRYTDSKGNRDESHNPNGSVRDIAGIRNKEGNVFGMMPHPERATSKRLGNLDGIEVFKTLGLIPE